MDKTLLEQKIAEWNKACEFFASPEINKLLANEEKAAIKFLSDFWKNSEFNKASCEKHINTLKECDKLHSSNRDIIEKSKNFRGIATTFYTKDAQTFNEFRIEMGWIPSQKTPTPTPTPIPTPTPQHDDALMRINVEKWSKAIQYLRSEDITPLLESEEFTAIEILGDMWRKPAYNPEMKRETEELTKILIDSHKLHASNREIIEHSKNLCGVARKVYISQEAFDAFKKAITKYYKENKTPRREPKKTPIPTPTQKHSSEIVISEVLFADTDYESNIIVNFSKRLFNNASYIKPRITVTSDYHGYEEIEIIMKYSDGRTSTYTCNIEFNGPGNYNLIGWGSRNGTSYLDVESIEYTFKWQGKTLWVGMLRLDQSPNAPKTPVISDVKFGATNHDGDVIVPFGNNLPTGIDYLTPRIRISNEFKGSIQLDVEFVYLNINRDTSHYTSNVSISGKGEYTLSGWGNSSGTSYTENQTIQCTIRYKGQILWQGKVKIGNGGSGTKRNDRQSPRRTPQNNHHSSGWQKFKNRIESIGEWFADEYDSGEDSVVQSIVTVLLFIIYIIAVGGVWISDGFWSALLAGVGGFFVLGLALWAIKFVVKIVLLILSLIFRNVWTFLIACLLVVAQIVVPFVSSNIKEIFSSNDTEQVIESNEPAIYTYYCISNRGVNVRQAPSADAAVVGAITYQQEVEVYGFENGFAEIRLNGEVAWVSSKYIKIDEDTFFKQNGRRSSVKEIKDGLQYEVICEGFGERPKAGDQVRCNYKITLLDGTLIDSTYEPIQFGVDKVILGWSEALLNMEEGAVWKVYIHSDLAYGANGRGDVPSYSTLILELELVEIVE